MTELVKVERVPSSWDSGMVPRAGAANVEWPPAEPPGWPAVVPASGPTLERVGPDEPPAPRAAAADERSSRQNRGGKLLLQDALLGLTSRDPQHPDVCRETTLQNV